MRSLDFVLLQATGQGLSRFQPTGDRDQPLLERPLFTMHMDEGSPGYAALWSMISKLRLRVLMVRDISQRMERPPLELSWIKPPTVIEAASEGMLSLAPGTPAFWAWHAFSRGLGASGGHESHRAWARGVQPRTSGLLRLWVGLVCGWPSVPVLLAAVQTGGACEYYGKGGARSIIDSNQLIAANQKSHECPLVRHHWPAPK